MKLLLQAGIHLIKKVITFVIYGRSVQVFKACTLFLFFPAEFFFSQIFLRGEVLSHRFHRYTQIFFIMIFLHRISRMNRKAFLLAGLLTDFRGILAAGQWLAPYICSCCFLSRRFRRWRRFFFVGRVLSHRFHRYYTDFLWNLWWISLSNLRGYLQRPDRSHLRKSVSNRLSSQPPNKFREIRWIKKSHEKKSASSAKSAWQKKRPNKYLCISVKSVGQKTPMKKSV